MIALVTTLRQRVAEHAGVWLRPEVVVVGASGPAPWEADGGR